MAAGISWRCRLCRPPIIHMGNSTEYVSTAVNGVLLGHMYWNNKDAHGMEFTAVQQYNCRVVGHIVCLLELALSTNTNSPSLSASATQYRASVQCIADHAETQAKAKAHRRIWGLLHWQFWQAWVGMAFRNLVIHSLMASCVCAVLMPDLTLASASHTHTHNQP